MRSGEGLAWNTYARSLPCVMCGRTAAQGANVQGHHIITKQELKKLPDFEKRRWDLRNCLPLCEACHARHHSRVAPVSMHTLLKFAPNVVTFAREIDRVWWLSRVYPGWRKR